MEIYVDATTLIALGHVGELDLLTVFDGGVPTPVGVRYEVTVEPAQSNLEQHLASADTLVQTAHGQYVNQAQDVLDETAETGDVWLIAAVLAHRAADEPAAVVSDDRRVRTVARGFGATVTGPIGVVVRDVVDGELTADEAKALVRRLDGHGLHMTGELRENADELIDDAAEASEE